MAPNAPEKDDKLWTFLKSVGGITGAVLTAVLIYHFTKPAPEKPTPQPVAVNGFVADAASQRLLRNASVTVSLGPNKVQQFTDSDGRYSVVLAATSAATDMGSVQIVAKGYQPFANSVPLHPGDNFAEITLDPLAPAPMPSSTASAAPDAAAATPTTTPPTQASVTPATPAGPPARTINFGRAQIILRTPPPSYVKAAETRYAGVPKQ